jgi:hypothetical protein
MTAVVMFLAGAGGGGLVAFHAGIAAHRQRMITAARNAPGDQVARATIERLSREARHVPGL